MTLKTRMIMKLKICVYVCLFICVQACASTRDESTYRVNDGLTAATSTASVSTLSVAFTAAQRSKHLSLLEVFYNIFSIARGHACTPIYTLRIESKLAKMPF